MYCHLFLWFTVYICPLYLYTVATLPWEIQKRHFTCYGTAAVASLGLVSPGAATDGVAYFSYFFLLVNSATKIYFIREMVSPGAVSPSPAPPLPSDANARLRIIKKYTFNVNSRTRCIHYVRVVVEQFVFRSAHSDCGHSTSGRLQQVFVIIHHHHHHHHHHLSYISRGPKRFILILKVR